MAVHYIFLIQFKFLVFQKCIQTSTKFTLLQTFNNNSIFFRDGFKKLSMFFIPVDINI